MVMKKIFAQFILYTLLVLLTNVLMAADELGDLKTKFSESISSADRVSYALAICEIYDTNQKDDVDSLIKYAKLSMAMAIDREDILKSKRYYADGHAFIDSSVYFSEMHELRSMYLDDGKALEAVNLTKQMLLWNAYKLDMAKVRFYAQEGFALLDEIESPTSESHDLRALFYYYIANSYNYGDSYELALVNALKMAEIAEEYDLSKRTLMSYEILGNIYSSLQNNSITRNQYGEEAKKYFIKAYEKAQASSFEDIKYGSAFNLGTYYADNDQIEEAKEYLEYALEKARLEKSMPFEFNSLVQLGKTYVRLSRIDEATVLCDQAKSIAEYVKTTYYTRSVNSLYADIYLAKNDFDQARKFGEKALNEILTGNDLEIQLIAYRLLEKIETSATNWKKALHYDKEADKLQDSILNENAISNIQSLKDQNEIKNKEKEISYLLKEKENEKLKTQNKLSILGGLLSIALGAFILYLLRSRNKKLVQEKNFIQLEQKLLRSQMNPHFIFNAISSIQNYLFDKNDLNIALHYMSKFAALMRQILENSREESITLSEEVETLKNYLELQQLRYNNNFGYEISIDEDIDPDRTLVPPLIAQPFVENAIEHGMIYRIENGKVIIEFNNEDDKIGVYIRDNGVAGKEMKLENKRVEANKKSLATIITKERLAHISTTNQRKFNLVTEILSGGGTLVSMTLPKISAI